MEGKGGFFILIGIVAFLSLTLALLAGYVFFVGGNNSSKDQKTEASHSASSGHIPTESELAYEPVFEGKQHFNLKNNDDKKISVIRVSIKLAYYTHVKGIEKPEAKVKAYINQIREMVGTYFLSLSINDVQATDAKAKAKKELTKKINDFLKETQVDTSKDIIYDVVFDDWFFQ